MSRVEEFVAARVAFVAAACVDVDWLKAKAARLWAAMDSEERREAEKGYHEAMLAESRRRK